jgi:hypothetical protein
MLSPHLPPLFRQPLDGSELMLPVRLGATTIANLKKG